MFSATSPLRPSCFVLLGMCLARSYQWTLADLRKTIHLLVLQRQWRISCGLRVLQQDQRRYLFEINASAHGKQHVLEASSRQSTGTILLLPGFYQNLKRGRQPQRRG